MAKKIKAVGSNGEPLGREPLPIVNHSDKIPTGNAVIPTVDESHTHDKTTNAKGIHEGKRPKFVSHSVE